jgi:hypothetical protein
MAPVTFIPFLLFISTHLGQQKPSVNSRDLPRMAAKFEETLFQEAKSLVDQQNNVITFFQSTNFKLIFLRMNIQIKKLYRKGFVFLHRNSATRGLNFIWDRRVFIIFTLPTRWWRIAVELTSSEIQRGS